MTTCDLTFAALARGDAPDPDHLAACPRCAALLAPRRPSRAPMPSPNLAAYARRARRDDAARAIGASALAAAALFVGLSITPREAGPSPDLVGELDLAFAALDHVSPEPDELAVLGLLDPAPPEQTLDAADLFFEPL